MERKYIITIARQFGSGGREIGKALADSLGILRQGAYIPCSQGKRYGRRGVQQC